MLAQKRNEDGAVATEYVLLIAGIAAVVIVAILGYGLFLSDKWTGTTGDIQTQVDTLSKN